MILLRIALPMVILAACGYGTYYFVTTKPEPRKFTPPPLVTQVEGTKVQTTDYQIYLKTRGTIFPRTTTTLFPEVSGKIVSISPHFREGGFFEVSEVLVSIEKPDYETALIIANGQLAQTRTLLEEEIARGRAAAENWRRLGRTGTPSDMVLRIPQRQEAEAKIQAAQAEVERAQRNLERTEVRAPYSGRISQQMVDVGQYVSPGTQLARAFATDVMEVRLPLNHEQIGFVDLPENFRNDRDQQKGPGVVITAQAGGKDSHWEGRIVRVDSEVDAATRQLFVVAEINDPYLRSEGKIALKIGMFVDALIMGNLLRNVIVLPRSAVRVSGEVIVIDQESKIRRQAVEPIWKSDTEVVLPAEGSGISPGDVICLTPIAYPVNGAPVIATIDGMAPRLENVSGLKGDGEGKSKGQRDSPPGGVRPPGETPLKKTGAKGVAGS